MIPRQTTWRVFEQATGPRQGPFPLGLFVGYQHVFTRDRVIQRNPESLTLDSQLGTRAATVEYSVSRTTRLSVPVLAWLDSMRINVPWGYVVTNEAWSYQGKTRMGGPGGPLFVVYQTRMVHPGEWVPVTIQHGYPTTVLSPKDSYPSAEVVLALMAGVAVLGGWTIVRRREEAID
jgi:hypothetical protein